MVKYYYKKTGKSRKRKTLRALSLGVFVTGIIIILYVFFPFISWQIYFAPAFANQNIASPIPKSNFVSKAALESLIVDASNNLSGVDYENAQNWFPRFKSQDGNTPKTTSYTISIPKLKIKDASVTTVDNDLAKHLVNYGGTAIPPDKGNAVVFGHSTLPQLFQEGNYKTTFTYLYELSEGDEIIVKVASKTYKYKIESVIVIDPENTSVLEQTYDDSYLTLITCTPPGTIWKRLVIKSRLEKI